jgi:lipase chaperone LimK
MNKTGIVITVIVVLIIIGFIFQKRVISTQSIDDVDSIQAQTLTNDLPDTLADKWYISESASQNVSAQQDDLIFAPSSIYQSLQAVKVDEEGKLILDHDAFLALDEALARIYDRLDASSLAQLQALIKAALPGITGEQTAELVADYYRFLGAKAVFSSELEPTVENATDTVEQIDDNQQLYQELKALRELHLGTEAATELFRVSDAAAEYMFESMKLGLDNSLSDEQKAQVYQALQDKQIRDSLNIENWDNRFATYNIAKSDILNSGLSQQAKEAQVQALIAEHFSASEVQKMQYFGLDGAY